MRVSKRQQKASVAKADIAVAIHKLQRDHGLTDIEMLQVLTDFLQGTLKYMLRFERHGDYDTPAGLDKDTT